MDSYAGDFSSALNALKSKNYEKAVKILRVDAERGDKHSQHFLGVLLYKGKGIKKNHKESFKWLDLAAKQGLSQARFDLGILIYHRAGIPEKYIDKYK